MVHVAIVGGYGSAGVAVADELLEQVDPDSDLELELTLIDDGDPGGGLCILRGCMPSKEVLSAGQHRFQARHDDRLEGVPEPDPEAIVARKDDDVLGFAEHRRNHVHDLATRENVEFVADTARFVDDRVLELAGSGRRLEPDYVVIATGSTLNVPDLPGIDEVSFDSSADVLDATAFPESGVVMGFGYIGLELAPYLSEVGGVDLTVIEHDDYPLDEMDAAYGETILELYREEFGIEVLTNTDEKHLERTDDDGVRLYAEQAGDERVVEADQLYCFTGRRPDLDGLGLEHTRLEAGEGWVEPTMQAVDDERVFVVGDANAREPILHVAKEQGVAAARNVIGHHRGTDLEPYTNVPHHVIFSGLGVYPFARIGHTPATVAESGMDAIVVSREASDDGVFKTKNHPEGLATLIVDADTGSVLGYQGLHLHADVMAKTMQLAVEMTLDVRKIPDRAYHPTTPEIIDGLVREARAELEKRNGARDDG
ncbi:pyridine nucleotide-disulfide oxidoreductase [Halobiforma lacisalsi AJ5]|uniref:Dihydrolipoyl dehydrogenase n=1 Tax=Natronobacterium lacisalsi AJ5 TaxID=358396 RepID=M0LUZ0_NATLA|nr:NAD(P)/FAD-dependent oxidoreductase [Halobiforma lacisalsi]APW97644.1 pyridine nucleotide-disulfide oxidoreductase [Halobiforma lacisalsi AJ5]EMA36968.1 dihydrolipoyl dehydrogenase [Halobiforma lacisalsi AJ5]